MRHKTLLMGMIAVTALWMGPAVAAEKTEKAAPLPPVEHKLVYINGVHSITMAGDGTDTPIVQNALPKLLAAGWLIKSVVVNRDEKAQKVGGYVVLERVRK